MNQKKPVLSKNFANRLRHLREKKKWSQAQLAIEVQAEHQRISKYERDIMFPTVDMIIKLAAAFEVSVDYLLLDELKEEVETRIHHINDQKLFERFKYIDKLPENERKALNVILDSFLKQYGLITSGKGLS